MHTYKTLTLAEAHLILDAAQKKAEELGVPEVLCVADNAGYPIALRRLDGGKVTSVQIAMNKAFTAAGHRKRTDNYKNSYPGEEAFGIFTQHEGRFTVFVGGFPIFVDGQCVGLRWPAAVNALFMAICTLVTLPPSRRRNAIG